MPHPLQAEADRTLSEAIEDGNYDAVVHLLDLRKSWLREAEPPGWALLQAIQDNQDPIATLLILRNANVNYIHENSYTPLMEAVHANNPTLVKLLLDNGAKVNLYNGIGMSAKDWVSGSTHPDIISMLNQVGKEPEPKNNHGLSVCYWCKQPTVKKDLVFYWDDYCSKCKK